MSHTVNRSRILIVDDVPGNIKTLIAILEDGYDLSIATSGPAALKSVASRPPDLILLDVVMPDMNGFEVCKRLKANRTSRDIPIIFITAVTDADQETRALELGAADFLYKPVNPPVVLARVKTQLGYRKARKILEEQNRELKAASELREEVNRIMQHDLKTPLNAIIGLSDMLCDTLEMDGYEKRICRTIHESGYRLLNMINLSLDLFKMEQNSYRFQPQEVDLCILARKVSLALQREMGKKQLTIDIRLDGQKPEEKERFPVLGEELLCFSILNNLLQNAIDASPAGETLTLSLERLERPTTRIHNHGAIPESIRGRFFDKYVTHGKTTGTGLGTYSARLMVQTLGGEIGFESSEENGTTLTVQWPTPE